ncbi:MAG: hypothetical protein IPI85_14300 [Dehalococcoidia bacterium]|nr:hypothetical protein [Dehalococcoidia bacterium]
MDDDSRIRYATSNDGTRIAWKAKGQGPSLIFAPPWPITLAWLGPWPTMIESRFDGRVIYYDRRGFGNSERHVEHSIERYADDLEAVADAAGLDDIMIYSAVVSCSEALHLAARGPRVTRAALGEPVLSGREWLNRSEIRPLLAVLDRDPSMFLQVMVQFASGWGRSTEPFTGGASTREPISIASEDDLRATIDAYAACELDAIAPLVRAECLITHNTGDSLVADPHSARLAQLLPNATLLLWSAAERWVFPPEVVARVREFLGGEPASTALDAGTTPSGGSGAAQLLALSAREREVLALVAAGKTNREIAEKLVVAEATAARHVHNILNKLDLANRVEAATWAARHGL